MKTQEQKTQDMKNYLDKTSKHIFLNGKGEYWALVKTSEVNYRTVTAKETRSWEQLSAYLKYYQNDPKAFFQNQFFPMYLRTGDRSGVFTAIKKNKVDPDFLKLIEAVAPAKEKV